MKGIRYNNESFGDIKGHSIVLGTLDAFTCAYTRGFYRLRVFGYGVAIKDLTIFNKTLCDLRKKGYRFGKWHFRFIKL